MFSFIHLKRPCQIALRVPLISAHCVRSNGWHVRLPFGWLNPQRSGHLGRKIIKTWLLWFLDHRSTLTSFAIDQVEFFL